MLLSATLLLLIILPLFFSVLLSLDGVQRYVLKRATHIASNKIGSKVAIGSITFTMPIGVTLHEVLVEDHAADTLLYSDQITARLSTLSLLHNELVLSQVEAKGGELQLREIGSGVLNIKEVVQTLINPDKESNFKTTLESIKVQDFDFSLKRLTSLKREFGVDLSDIRIHNIKGEISDLVSHKKITEMTIDSFSGVEQSGLEIKSGSGHLVVYDGVLDITNFHALVNSSQINLPHCRLEGESWEDYRDFNERVSIQLTSERSRLRASDVAYFAPALKDRSFTARNINLDFNGTVNKLETQLKNMEFGKDGRMAGNLAIRGVTQFESAQFDIEDLKVDGSLTDVNNCIIGFGSEALAGKASEIVGALGQFSILADAHGSMERMSLDAALESKYGGATYVGEVVGALQEPQILGAVATQKLELGRLLSQKSLGAIDMRANVDYNSPSLAKESTAKGNITMLGYNSCIYSGIDFSATLDGDVVEGAISSQDNKFDFDLAGVVGFGSEKDYNITMRVNRADLNALAINDRDSISVISGSVKVNLKGNTIDDMSGSVTLRNTHYRYNDESIYAPMIDVVARNSVDNKFIGLESDFVDATFNSKSSFESIFSYLKEGLRDYIPVLYTTPTERNRERSVTIANKYSTLSIDFKRFSEISNAISSGFNVADNTSFNLMVNPFSERFALRLKSDYIEHNSLAATDININASNDNDSLSLYATSSNIFVGRNSFSAYTLMAGARDNVVELSTGFRDSATSTTATLGMNVKFDGFKQANITLLPSNISMADERWLISANNITATKERIEVDDFRIINGAQRLSLNGRASKNPSDSLTLMLKNYDISMITSVIDDLGYSVNGLSNGYVKIKQAFGNPQIVADVALDSIDVNTIPSPPLNLSARWNTKENRARVVITDRNNNNPVVTGYYAPADVRYYAKLQVDSLNMGLLDPLLKSTIKDTRGYANVDVTLSGERRDASLHGTIDIYDVTTKILFTQVEYSIPSARIDVDDNRLTSYARKMYDKDGNEGLVTMNLSLDHLSNVSYNLRIVPENMLVLNTTEKDNELFYGKLYASGVATITGDKRGVNMDITATSQPNSSFFMPLSTQSTVAKTDFITFVKENKEEQDNKKINFRRNYVEERQKRMNPQATALNINMALHATPDLDFQLVIDPVVGDIIKARGEGRMNINVAPHKNLFEMYGDYNITEGNYLFTLLNPITKRFTVESGSSIQWTGDAINPLLNIDAVYKVKTSLDPLIYGTSGGGTDNSSSRAVPVDCIIHLGDRLAQPSVDFSIEVPTADTEQQAVIANTLIDQETISQQFLYLMFANSFIPVTSSYGSGLATSTTASTGFELLTNQLSNWLSSSNYNVVIRYRPESDLTSDEVDLGFSRGLIDNRLLIEVEGNYLADNKAAINESNFSNFMGEAYVTWLIDKAGSLRLKGFTQTIDRYDENQGLQETGIGVYYSESFNTFKDLGQKIVDRFKRKRKKAKN